MRSLHTSLSGFTLIELLVVMTIVGILAAIAIPQYDSYKKRAFDTRAVSDLQNIAIAEEAYFLDFESYLSCVDNDCTRLPGVSSLSKGVQLTIDSSATGFVGSAYHARGTGKIFEWDSSQGGLRQ